MKKFEFVLRIDNNIICQRFFTVKTFNQKVLRSLDLKYIVDDIVNYIKDDLKLKSKLYLWDHYNPYIEQKDVVVSDIYKEENYFIFEVKIDNRVVSAKMFDANVYPHKVRFDVNIKHLVGPIISELQGVFSSNKFETEFCDQAL